MQFYNDNGFGKGVKNIFGENVELGAFDIDKQDRFCPQFRIYFIVKTGFCPSQDFYFVRYSVFGCIFSDYFLSVRGDFKTG